MNQIKEVEQLKEIIATDGLRESDIYKCGHRRSTIVSDSNPLTIAAYLEWADSVGYGGDMSECWDCFCNKGGQGR